ncbi:catalase family peroxidase [Methylobacterium sp. E-041]|uniref:catalase family peroxidase n=1 Tax=unclassified Methylobacterium TaxID=2615210 RepID=UPI001FBBB23D|nr:MULTISPECIES: catalase family peroxidase [unclassified Methylobacterium]MCJ2040642.1 catalase family peroxidase [Methylobacterium sp. J-059]MCJ2074350.1 catalase family peroxidase [Methylobacterium sp. E-016]MCJ2106644.1 catalase family peroxidase [Methylobacterium sp. E-041]
MTRIPLLRRALAGGLMLAGLAGTPVSAEDGTTAEQTVDAMNTLWGQHPGMRANHAKGTVVEGRFTPSAEAAKLSKASVFAGAAVPVTARFSDATGLPTIADGAANANPHGLSLKFKLADGSEMDVVTNSLKYFPVATGEEFRDLLVAIAKSGKDAGKPTPAETFVASHPAAGKAGATARTPTSLARQTYNGVNAFILVDASGKRQAFRYRIVPVEGEELLGSEEAAKQAPDHLMSEIRTRLGKAPVSYKVLAQLAEPGDRTDDATQPWPEERRLVEMGTLTLTKPVADSASAEKALLFLPNALTDGIEVSDDPLIDARVQAYAVSFGRRSQ